MPDTNDQPDAVAPELDDVTAGLAAQGFALVDSLPANHRLRAEALAQNGKTEDPNGYVTPDEIADAKARLAAEADEAGERAKAEPSMSWKKPDLVAEASRRGVEVDDSATKADILGAIVDTPATPSNEG